MSNIVTRNILVNNKALKATFTKRRNVVTITAKNKPTITVMPAFDEKGRDIGFFSGLNGIGFVFHNERAAFARAVKNFWK